MFYAAILAGGLSSRMGEDKAGLCLRGQTLLQRAEDLLDTAGAELVLVSGRAAGYRGVADLLPHCGPPGALYSLIDHIRQHYGLDGSALVLVPVDMPLLTAAAIRQLVAAAVNAECCHYEGELFPCVLKATPDLYTHLRNLFTEGTELGGRRSMRAIVNFYGAKEIPLGGLDPAQFSNVNTPQEWQALRELHG